MDNCIFCQIADHRQKADIIYEDKQIVVFKDINPSALVHLLIVPKKHIQSVNQLKDGDKKIISEMIFLARDLAEKQGITDGYKLLFNVGRKGGQLVDHLHLHLMGGGEIKK